MKYGGAGLVGTVGGMVGSRIYHSKDIELAQLVKQYIRLTRLEKELQMELASLSSYSHETKTLRDQIDKVHEKLKTTDAL